MVYRLRMDGYHHRKQLALYANCLGTVASTESSVHWPAQFDEFLLISKKTTSLIFLIFSHLFNYSTRKSECLSVNFIFFYIQIFGTWKMTTSTITTHFWNFSVSFYQLFNRNWNQSKSYPNTFYVPKIWMWKNMKLAERHSLFLVE